MVSIVVIVCRHCVVLGWNVGGLGGCWGGCGTFVLDVLADMMGIDQEKKKWRPQQEGTRPRQVPALLQLLSLCSKG